MAIVDANYNFVYVNIGAKGSSSDGGVYGATPFYRKLTNNQLHLPDAEPLRNRQKPMPYFIVADDAFPIGQHLMKPYPKRNLSIIERAFNYRLSRARRVVENAFGILASRFRLLHTMIELAPKSVELVIQTCCILHNFFMSKEQPRLDENELLILRERELREENGERNNEEYDDLQQLSQNVRRLVIEEIRSELAEYFIRIDEIPAQYTN